jgi:hypothetical protein
MGSKDGQVTERLVVISRDFYQVDGRQRWTGHYERLVGMSRRCLGTMPGVTFKGRAFAQGECRALHRCKAYRQINLMEIESLSRYILVSCHPDASTILKARKT